jgi:hypothetical protein
MKRTGWIVIAITALVACGDDTGETIDARIVDAAIDAETDAPPGPCGAELQMTGEYVDWDSTQAAFDGVEGATWQVVGGAMATTAPNGRVILCIPRGATSQIDVTATGYLPARFVADPAVFTPAGSMFSVRGLKTAMATAQFNEFGVTYDMTAAQVLVYKIGAPVPLTLAPGGGDGTFVSDGDDDITWTAGNTGALTLFPNRPVGAGSATLMSTGQFTGPTMLPLAAGRFTLAVIR